MSKRPLQGSYPGASSASKRPKTDHDNFKTPSYGTSGTSNVLKTQKNFNQFQNRFKQSPPSTSKSGKSNGNIPKPSPVPLADKELMDSDDDELCVVMSQQEEERRMNERRQQASEEINLSVNFTQFMPWNKPTSTQLTKIPNSSNGYTEEIRQNLFNLPENTQQTQKENVTLTQSLTVERNKTKALETQLKNQKHNNVNLMDKLTRKEGENTNLRRENNQLLQQMEVLRFNNMKEKEAEMNKFDPDRDKLRREVEQLKTQLAFQKLPNFPKRKIVEPTSRIPFFTNISRQTNSRALEISTKVFDIEEKPASKSLEAKREELETSEDVVKIQLKLSRVNAMLLAGGHLEHSLLDSLFEDAVSMIFHICGYIDYLEIDGDNEISADSDSGLTVCAMISVPMLREKLTTFNPIDNAICKDEGFVSLFQAGKLFNDELCSKARRIIACIATVARSSRVFSEKLLFENVSEETEDFRTFVSMLMEKLVTKVTESKRVYDYSGLAMASASLLASLGSHFEHYNHDIVDDIFFKFLRSVLECRCDNPMIMKDISEFLVYATDNGNSSSIVSRLCTSYPRERIVSRSFKFSHHPEAACTFRIFTMYLLTAFNFDSEMNRREFELLTKTAGNLNRIALNMQAAKHSTVRFLNCNETTRNPMICTCFPMLTDSLIFLNHQALAYRHFSFKEAVQSNQLSSQSKDEYHATKKELARSFTIALANLFDIIDLYTDFPIENLVFTNRNEQICSIIKRKRYNIESYDSSLKTINVVPTYTPFEDVEPMKDSESESDSNYSVSLREIAEESLLEDAV